jgi:hypothetical protein
LEADGLRLVDLGSRNGCWVNEKKVDECILEPSDAIRLGGLRISYEEDLPAPQEEDAGRTIQLSAPGAVRRQDGVEPPEDTMLFVESSPPDKDGTVVLSESPPLVEDTGTVVFTKEGVPGTTTRSMPVLEETKPLAEESEADEGDVASLTDATIGGRADRDVFHDLDHRRPGTLALLVAACSSILVYLLLAVPLLFMTRSELFQESLRRGDTLFGLLQTKSAQWMGSEPRQELSLDAVLTEPGVREAFVLSPDGQIVLPRDRVGDSLDTIEDLAIDSGGVDSVQQNETDSGNWVYLGPLVHGQRRVGVAVMVYAPAPMARGPWIPILVAVGLFIMVAGAIAAYLMSLPGDSETTLAESPAPEGDLEITNSDKAEDG